GTLRWGITSVVDTAGNTVGYTWNRVGCDVYPGSIQFGPYVASLMARGRSARRRIVSVRIHGLLGLGPARGRGVGPSGGRRQERRGNHPARGERSPRGRELCQTLGEGQGRAQDVSVGSE